MSGHKKEVLHTLRAGGLLSRERAGDRDGERPRPDNRPSDFLFPSSISSPPLTPSSPALPRGTSAAAALLEPGCRGESSSGMVSLSPGAAATDAGALFWAEAAASLAAAAAAAASWRSRTALGTRRGTFGGSREGGGSGTTCTCACMKSCSVRIIPICCPAAGAAGWVLHTNQCVLCQSIRCVVMFALKMLGKGELLDEIEHLGLQRRRRQRHNLHLCTHQIPSSLDFRVKKFGRRGLVLCNV